MGSIFEKLIYSMYGENWGWNLARNHAIISAGFFVVESYQLAFKPRSSAFFSVCKRVPLIHAGYRLTAVSRGKPQEDQKEP
jgi:hypothetical protein